MNFQNMIRTLQKHGMTYSEIGQISGLSVLGISEIANGRTTNPGGASALKIHDLYKRIVKRESVRPVYKKRGN